MSPARKGRLFGAALVLLLAIGQTVAARAEIRSNTFTLSPLAGGYLFEGQQPLKRNAPNFGLALGYNYAGNLGAEGAFQYLRAEADQAGNKRVSGYLYHLDGLYHFFPQSRIVPYLAAGFGALTLNPYLKDAQTDGLFDWGGGLKLFATKDLALRIDLRHLVVFDHPENNLSYTAGLTYQFGGRAIAATPAPTPADRDGDGIIDSLDRCPDTPRGVEVDAHGCPLDSDGDGVADYLDRCPDTPRGELIDDHGCTLKLTLHINFDIDQATIKPEFHKDLEQAAAFIKQHANVPYIVIAGYTDSTGKPAYNQALSERRADAVREALIRDFGIDPKKLVARGYGENRPVADNATAEGRYQNRRVEIVCCAVLPP